MPARDVRSGEIVDLLDVAIERRTRSGKLIAGGDGSSVVLTRPGDAKQLDVIHGPAAGRSVRLTATSVDLTAFLGAGAGSIALRDQVVVWNAGGRSTVLDDGLPYRMGLGLAIVRPSLPMAPARDGVVHRLPVFERRVSEHVLGPVRPPDADGSSRQFPAAVVAVPLVGGVVGAVAFGRPEFLIISAMAPIASLATWSSERSRSRKRQRAEHDRFDSELAAVLADGASIGSEVSRLAHEHDLDLAALYRRVMAEDGRIWDRDVTDPMTVRIGTAPGRAPIAIGVDSVGSSTAGGPRSPGGPVGEAIAQLRSSVETVADLPVCADLAGGSAGGLAIVGPDPMLVHDVTRAVIAQLACRYPPSQLRLEVPDDVALNAARWLPHVATRRPGGVDTRVRVRVAVDSASQPVPQLRPDGPAIWVTGDPRRIPRWCDAVVMLDGADGQSTGAATALVRTRSGDRRFEPDRLDADRFDDLARAMAPLREAGAAASRPDDGLLDVLDVSDAPAMRQRWSSRDRVASDQLAVALGVDDSGPIGFDLEADGPHALIAGTTGSGKSMLLQTVLLSLAAAHAPGRVQFLGIDFKGGATFHPLRDLPHCAGLVTNLDGPLAERVLVSLRAELGRRMRLLSGRAPDLAGLRAIDPEGAPPSLVIVIDEFAVLVRELPGFVDAIVDLAQRGRSLGLHLILATQRPTGAVNDAILANTNIRIAMRTADAAESVAIIGDRRAADLTRPGQGLVRFGARPPAPFHVPDLERRAGSAGEVTTWSLGREPELAVRRDDGDSPSDRSRLLAIIEAAAVGLPSGTRPWLDPLPDDVTWSQLAAVAPGAVGVIDRPERQDIVALEPPASGVLVVCGARSSGRSNAVAAAVQGARARHGAAVRVHVVDWAGRSPVAECVDPDVLVGPGQVEALIRLIQLLALRIDTRWRGGGAPVAEVSASPDVPEHEIPEHEVPEHEIPEHEVVAIDGIAQLIEDLQSIDHGHWVSVLARVMREASSFGVLFVVGALRHRDLPATLQASVTAGWQLRPSHVDDLSGMALPGSEFTQLLGATSRVAATGAMPPGRAIVDGHWAQIARMDPRSPGARSWPGPPCLPARWSLGSIDGPVSDAMVVGMCDLTFGLLAVAAVGHVAVVGPPGSGRTNGLEVVARQWPAGRRVLLAGSANPLHRIGGWDHRLVLDDPELPASLRDAIARDGEILIVVDDVDDVPESAMAALDIVAGDRRATFVVAGPPARFERAHSGWLAEVKRSGRIVVLQPDRPGDVEQLTGRRVRLRPDQPMGPGRGVWVDRRTATLVQMPLAPGSS